MSNYPRLYNSLMLEKEIPESELGYFPTLVSIIERLRAPGGCPWDREQTHASLKRNLLEECYEVLEAIDRGESGPLAEELGDLLVQIAFHADIAREKGEFNIADVITAVNRKLVRRHPHVFGDAEVADAREVERNWERLKGQERAEKGIYKSPVEGIPKDLPALVYAQLMQDRVARAGFEWKDVSGVLDKVQEEVEELRRAGTTAERLHEMGDLLLVMVNLCRWLDFQAEDALRGAIAKFSGRYLQMEDLVTEAGEVFADLPLREKEAFWQQAKKLEG
jgi:tetrapyrrole methylase family protein/MazG family protein